MILFPRPIMRVIFAGLILAGGVLYLPSLPFYPSAENKTIIYSGRKIVTMDEDAPYAEAVAVRQGRIVAVGALNQLSQAMPKAQIDRTFTDHVILPGFIDPHIHMLLAAIQYALPIAPPWPIPMADGLVDGLDNRAAFLTRIAEIATQKGASKKPLVIYGYHDLIHGPLTRHDLDKITDQRPLFIWHYSSHDFYLNSKALDWANVTAALHQEFEGIALDEEGALTGRIYEDALPALLEKLAPILVNPLKVRTGAARFSRLLRAGGVTSVADLGYGILGIKTEDLHLKFNWSSAKKSGYRLYLVPEHRAFLKEFGDRRIGTILKMTTGEIKTPAPVLPQVKFFTDAAFYSQTMRLSAPGYKGGQSAGEKGLWVTPPEVLTQIMRPYWAAGLDVRIHSNGDAAQIATLDALETLSTGDDLKNGSRRISAQGPSRRYVIEHAGLFPPEQIARAAKLGATVSAASHYVAYLGEAYQPILGAEKGAYISPLNSLSRAGAKVTLHSDAPLAPPLPLYAAQAHLTRATREGGVLTPTERLARFDALEAITSDAAYALGLEAEIGRIKNGLRADFTILSQNPLETENTNWQDIEIWGVVLNGRKQKLAQPRS